MVVRGDARGVLDQVVVYGALTASVTAALVAVFTPKRRARRAPGAKTPPAAPASEGDGFRWGVMGVISCIPLFSWLAWVFAALEDEENARTYYYLAALYALPLLRSGFDFDWFTITMLLAGVAHVQMERIAHTEPELQLEIAQQLRPLAVVRTAARAAGAVVSAAIGRPAGARDRQLPPGEGAGQLWDEGVGGEEEDSGSTSEYELEAFDRELRERDRRGRQQRR